MLHPAELARIAEKVEGPGWFLDTATAIPAAEDECEGVPHLLSDYELSQHADPAAALSSWLDSPRSQ